MAYTYQEIIERWEQAAAGIPLTLEQVQRDVSESSDRHPADVAHMLRLISSHGGATPEAKRWATEKADDLWPDVDCPMCGESVNASQRYCGSCREFV